MEAIEKSSYTRRASHQVTVFCAVLPKTATMQCQNPHLVSVRLALKRPRCRARPPAHADRDIVRNERSA